MSNHMSPFQTLPADCWCLVLSYLSQSDLANLARVSSDLGAFAGYCLYQEIRQPWNQLPFERLLQLLRTIHARPEYAAIIRSVEFEVPGSRELTLPNWNRSANSQMVSANGAYQVVLRFCRSIVEDAGFPRPAEWKKGLNEGNPYVYATLLISQLPNLRNLGLDCSFFLHGGFPGLMIRHAMLSPPLGVISGFEKLSSVRYGTISYGTIRASLARISPRSLISWVPSWGPEQLVGFFFLPALTRLSLGVPWPVKLAEHISLLCQSGNRHNLSNLQLCDIMGFMESEDLTFLFHEMQCIEGIRLMLEPPWTFGEQFEKVLQHTKSTLDRLEMSTFHNQNSWEMLDSHHTQVPHNLGPQNPKFPSGYFLEFPLLTKLTLNFSHFVGFDIEDLVGPNLPTSVKELRLIDDWGEVPAGSYRRAITCLVQFLGSDPWRHSRLQKIKVDLSPSFWERARITDPELRKLMAQCRGRGVMFVVG